MFDILCIGKPFKSKFKLHLNNGIADVSDCILTKFSGWYTPKIDMLFMQSVYSSNCFFARPIAKAVLLQTKYQKSGIALPYGPKHNQDERICACCRCQMCSSQDM